MDLGQIAREGRFSRRNFLKVSTLSGFALGTLFYMGCKIPTEFEHDVTIDTPETGLVSGRTIIPVINNNMLEWVGASGAEVKIGNTGIVVYSKANGLFGADNIPTGVHDIRGVVYDGVVWEYNGINSVLITRQGVSGVEINLYPQSIHSNSKLMYGRFYEDKAATTPLSNKRVYLRSWPWGQPNPGQTKISETRTSPDGSFGFFNTGAWERYYISIDGVDGGGDLKETGTENNYFAVDRSSGDGKLGVVKKDGYRN